MWFLIAFKVKFHQPTCLPSSLLKEPYSIPTFALLHLSLFSSVDIDFFWSRVFNLNFTNLKAVQSIAHYEAVVFLLGH